MEIAAADILSEKLLTVDQNSNPVFQWPPSVKRSKEKVHHLDLPTPLPLSYIDQVYILVIKKIIFAV